MSGEGGELSALPPGVAGRRLPAALVALSASLAWLELPDPPVGVHLDHGWALVLARALHLGARAGVEQVTTYGPLGALATGVYYPPIGAAQLLAACVFAVSGGLAVGAVFRGGPRLPLAAITSWALLRTAGHGDARFVLAALAAGLSPLALPGRAGVALLAGALLGLLALLKFTFLVLAVALVSLALWALPREGRRRAGGAALLGFLGAFLVGWHGAGQRLADLPAYLGASVELSRGYSLAMAMDGAAATRAGARDVAVLVALGLALAGSARALGRRPRAAFAMVAVVLALGWKEGFVRQDPQHEATFLGVALAAPLFGLAALGALPASAALSVARFALLGAALRAATLDRSVAGEPLGEFLALGRARDRAERALGRARDPARELRALDARWAEEAGRHALPEIRARVGRAPVDVASWDQSVAFWNDLAYRPRPVAQGYSAWTAALAERNAEALRGPGAPVYVIARWASIDERLPAADDGPWLVELLHRYEPVLEERGYLLFGRRASPLPVGPGEVLLDRELLFGEELQLELDPSRLHTLSLELRPTLRGRLQAALHHLPRPTLLTRQGSGLVKRYELVPGLVGAPFPITPLVEGNIDFPWIYGGTGRHLDRLRVDAPAGSAGCFEEPFRAVIRVHPGVGVAPR